MKYVMRLAALLTIAAIMIAWSGSSGPRESQAQAESKQASGPEAYRSPNCLALSPDGKTLYATDHTGGNVSILDTAGNAKRGEIGLRGKPIGIALSADGDTLYVAEHGSGTVAVIDTAKNAVAARISVGRWPTAVALAGKARRLYVCNQDSHTVSVVDLAQGTGKQIKQVPVIREPSSVAVTPDERFVVVANLLAHGPNTEPTLAAKVSIIDAGKLAVSATVKLPPGSTIVRDVCVSPDGKWAYVIHGLGRFNLPMTQLERGWVNTYALSIIDIAKGNRLVTMLLDGLNQGAADPHSVVCSSDGARLWISHAGTHEISFLEIGRVHELLSGKMFEELASLKDGMRPNVWVRIQKDRKVIAELENDLTALHVAGAIRRAPSGGNGPRGIALSPDEKKLFVANYYSGSVAVLDAARGRLLAEVSMGSQPKPDTVRRGEILFHDATHSFQYWHSCATCHPNDGRVDGLRWDFVDDGFGNAMSTPPVVLLHKTEPLHRLGTLATARILARSGLANTHMMVPTDQEVEDLLSYMVSLQPVPSPHLTAEGKLTEAAARGKALFEGKAACAECHPAPYFTDRKMYDVGVDPETEGGQPYDNPTLLEIYRTAPYLHDGRALTLEEVFTTNDKLGTHGKTKGLSAQELDDLVAYVLSL